MDLHKGVLHVPSTTSWWLHRDGTLDKTESIHPVGAVATAQVAITMVFQYRGWHSPFRLWLHAPPSHCWVDTRKPYTAIVRRCIAGLTLGQRASSAAAWISWIMVEAMVAVVVIVWMSW